MSEYLFAHGFRDLTICDRNADLIVLNAHGQTRLGEDYMKNLDDFDFVFRSPGISAALPELADIRAAGKLTSVTRYFFEHCPCPIIGVTGTKGKGTTATLISLILKEAGLDVFLGGNIGEPPVNFLDRLSPSSLVVLELSSFQLMDLDRSPHVAVVLNVVNEHMDYHHSFDEYISAKQNIARFQNEKDFLILNQDHSYAADFFSDPGIFRARKIFVNSDEGAVRDFVARVCPVSEIGLLGKHNLENIFSALAVARIFDFSFEHITKVVREFRGLPHRLELAGEPVVNGTVKRVVKFYNDSFSTTPETSIAGMLAFDAPLYLIAGGSEKFSAFDEWAATVKSLSNVKKVFLMGPSGKRMAALIGEKGQLVENLKEGFDAAVAEAAREGEVGSVASSVILLSPGAASFNEFKNYKERGEAFRNLVDAV